MKFIDVEQSKRQTFTYLFLAWDLISKSIQVKINHSASHILKQIDEIY